MHYKHINKKYTKNCHLLNGCSTKTKSSQPWQLWPGLIQLLDKHSISERSSQDCFHSSCFWLDKPKGNNVRTTTQIGNKFKRAQPQALLYLTHTRTETHSDLSVHALKQKSPLPSHMAAVGEWDTSMTRPVFFWPFRTFHTERLELPLGHVLTSL